MNAGYFGRTSIMNLIHYRIKYIKISITIHCWPLPVLQLWFLQAAENLSRLKSGNRLADPKKMFDKLVNQQIDSYLQAIALAIAVPEQFFLPGRLQLLESLFWRRGYLGDFFESARRQSDRIDDWLWWRSFGKFLWMVHASKWLCRRLIVTLGWQ